MKHCSDGVVVKDARDIAELSPAMVEVIESYNTRQKALLAVWIRDLARERARGDAETAVNGFIFICVLVAVAVSFLIAL